MKMDCNTCKVQNKDYQSENLFTWCTNCGNYGINGSLRRALVDMQLAPHEVMLCYDVGCNGNGADKIEANTFHGLHGRVIPFACGAKLGNYDMPVIASGGDGSTLGEGINHLIHAIRHNYNITFILHNNRNYGLTTGQASPTTPEGYAMNSTPDGVPSAPMEVHEMVFASNPSFYARTWSGNVKQMTYLIKEAINHQGFSMIEVLQDCPTYNKATPHEWYMERVYDVSSRLNYDRADKEQARKLAADLDNKIATGVLYHNPRKTFYDNYKGHLGLSTLKDGVRLKNDVAQQLLTKYI